MIAFTGEYDGNEDVYVIPAAGGIPKRLTSSPAGPGRGLDPRWQADSVSSPAGSYSGFPSFLPLELREGCRNCATAHGLEGAYSPDSSHIAYTPFTNFRENWQFQRGLKHYRGGTASPIWIAKLSDSSIEKVERKNSNDSNPMWIGAKSISFQTARAR